MMNSADPDQAAFLPKLRVALEQEEARTVGGAFGVAGTVRGEGRKREDAFRISGLRDLILARRPFLDDNPIERGLSQLPFATDRSSVGRRLLDLVVDSLVRFSFLIELTNLAVTSTKMKTRFVPGLIKKTQRGSFAVVDAPFAPGEDPRASTFEECCAIFERGCELLAEACQPPPLELMADVQLLPPRFEDVLLDLARNARVAYEGVLTYEDPHAIPCHIATNVRLVGMNDLRWLLRARELLRQSSSDRPDAAGVLKAVVKLKLRVKVYLSDRSLVGQDKTNRAKRWEILPGDYQFASLEQCWSVERKLTHDMILFDGFPADLRRRFEEAGLVAADAPVVRCPVTLQPLSFDELAVAVHRIEKAEQVAAATDAPDADAVAVEADILATEVEGFEPEAPSALAGGPIHGRSNYQVGHLHPLKKGGRHEGANVVWQTDDGNRIQGDRSLEETFGLIRRIARALDERDQVAGGVSTP